MTNAEKFLKDGVDIKKFVEALTYVVSYFDDLKFYSTEIEKELLYYLNMEAKND